MWVWGNAAEWVGAIGTAGALIATVVIIMSDRRRERQKRANALVTWVAADPYGGTPQATGRLPVVMIENTGSEPILAVHVFHIDGTGIWSMYAATSPDSKHGSPVAGAAIEIEIPDYKYGRHDRLFLKFIDAGNQHWIRDAKTGKYLRWTPWPYSSLWVYVKFKWRWRRTHQRGE